MWGEVGLEVHFFSVPVFSSSGTIAEKTFFSSCAGAFVANQLAVDHICFVPFVFIFSYTITVAS